MAGSMVPGGEEWAVGPTTRHRQQVNDQPTYPGAGGASQPPPSGSPLQGPVATATARIQVIIEAAEKAAAGIIDDAEAQARRYLEESRARADSIADDRAREMSMLTDSLIQQAETVKRQSDELIRALDQAKQQVRERFAEAPASAAPVEPAPVHRLKPVEPQTDFPVEALPPQEEIAPLGQVPPPNPEPPLTAPISVPPPGPEPVSATEEPVTPVEPTFPSPQEPPSAADRPIGTPPSDGARLLATQMAVAGSSRAEIESRLQNEFGIWDAGPMLDAILGREG